MSTITDVENYLSALSRLERSKTRGKVIESLPFITISRQTGAGGHSLADALLAAIKRETNTELFRDWQIFDHKLAQEVVAHKDLKVSMHSLLDENYRSQIGEFVLGLFGQQSPQDTVVLHMSETLRSVASLGKAIIIGRAAAVVTRELAQGLHVRLIAPEERRVKCIRELHHLSEERAREYIAQHDHERQRMLKTHFNANIDDPMLYDAIWNTGTISVDAIAEALLMIIKRRFGVR